ncbi:hypothetical protein [Photobacterium leiognathi]|uniref:hypothetical protein n=1 Tax=Photobacterium leiognathi TaxID=553611 RepID=UPI00298110D9|nr:hypothetical protein [Photobacterium leiognathi]
MKHKKWLALGALAVPLLGYLYYPAHAITTTTPDTVATRPKHTASLPPPPNIVPPVVIALDTNAAEIITKTHQLAIAKLDKALRETQDKKASQTSYQVPDLLPTVLSDNKEKQAPQTALSRLHYRGVIQTPTGRHGYLSLDNQSPIRVTTGSMIAGAKVVSISDTHITLRQGKQTRTLTQGG